MLLRTAMKLCTGATAGMKRDLLEHRQCVAIDSHEAAGCRSRGFGCWSGCEAMRVRLPVRRRD